MRTVLILAAICITMLIAECFLPNAILAQSNSGRHGDIVGFAAGGAGYFSLSMGQAPTSEIAGEPIYFSDLYGSENGPSFAGEAGVGSYKLGLYAVARFRYWAKSGSPKIIGPASFDGTLDYSQYFASLGGRYYVVGKAVGHRSMLPFIGGGIERSQATESVDGTISYQGFSDDWVNEEQVDGSGFYVEGGADFFLSPQLSLRALAIYSTLKLKGVDGGGGIFVGGFLSLAFGKSMFERE